MENSIFSERGVFNDLKNVSFMIFKDTYEKSYRFYFKNKVNGVFGIPVPDLDFKKNFIANHLEDMILNIFDGYIYFLDNNNYISISCNEKEIKAIKRELLNLSATEDKIFAPVSNLNFYLLSKNKLKLEILKSELHEKFTTDKIDEVLFFLSCYGFDFEKIERENFEENDSWFFNYYGKDINKELDCFKKFYIFRI